MRSEVFIIPKRSKPLSGRRYCTLKCLEAHLEEVADGEWVAIGVTTSYRASHSGLTIHYVAVSERDKSERMFRYRDAGEMHSKPNPKKTGYSASMPVST